MTFNIKADNYQDYQNKVKEAAQSLYKSGHISSGELEEILNSDLELPYIATENYEYYSIDTAPGFCIDWMIKALKYDIENKPKYWGVDTAKENLVDEMSILASTFLDKKIWDVLFGEKGTYWDK